MDKPLAGKVALVTGSGKNIGRAIALRLARDGASVVVNGRRDRAVVDAVVGEINALGGQAIGCIADVTDPAAVGRMIEQSGRDDGRARHPGQQRRPAPPDRVPRHEPRGMAGDPVGGARWRVHPRPRRRAAHDPARRRRDRRAVGHLDPCRHAQSLPRLGLEGGAGGTDAGARDRTRAAPDHLQLRLAGRGGHGARRFGGALPGTLGNDKIPLKRKASPEEIAAMVRMLVGPEGGYVTGQTIHVNGGVFLT